MFEGDSETIIKALNLDSSCLSPFGHIAENARALTLNFVSFCFSHVKRQGNAVADKLAKLAKHSPCPRYWSDDIPLQICVYGQNKKSSTIVGTKQTSTSTYIIHPLLLTRALLCKAF